MILSCQITRNYLSTQPLWCSNLIISSRSYSALVSSHRLNLPPLPLIQNHIRVQLFFLRYLLNPVLTVLSPFRKCLRNFPDVLYLLHNGFHSIRHGIHSLRNEIRSLRHEIRSLRHEIRSLRHEIRSLRNGIHNLRHGIHNLRNGIHNLRNGILIIPFSQKPFRISRRLIPSLHNFSAKHPFSFPVLPSRFQGFNPLIPPVSPVHPVLIAPLSSQVPSVSLVPLCLSKTSKYNPNQPNFQPIPHAYDIKPQSQNPTSWVEADVASANEFPNF